MKKALLITVYMLMQVQFLKAQSFQDPAVNDATVNPNPVSDVGSQFDMTFQLGNNGFDPISGADAQNQVSFTVNLSKCAPSAGGSVSTIGVDALSGTALNYFDIIYDAALNTFSGHQKAGVAIDAFGVFDLIIHATVTALSNTISDNSIGANLIITPNQASNGFNDPANDNGAALTHTTTLIVLPELLDSFTAIAKDCDLVQVDWKMATEGSITHFDIEYSRDAISFATVKTVTAKNSSAGSSYAAMVTLPDGSGYYRLKMADLNGHFTYSAIRSVKAPCRAQVITIMPNPVISNKTTIRGLAAGSTIRLFDLNGRLLLNTVTNGSAREIDFSGYAPGIYIIHTIQHEAVQSFMVSKQD